MSGGLATQLILDACEKHEDSIQVLITSVGVIGQNLELHTELLTQILDEVTPDPSSGPSEIGQLLREISSKLTENNTRLASLETYIRSKL